MAGTFANRTNLQSLLFAFPPKWVEGLPPPDPDLTFPEFLELAFKLFCHV